VFRTKPLLALELLDRALANRGRVQPWTFDEGYGRDTAFLDGLEQRGQVVVGEVPAHVHGGLKTPRVLRRGRAQRRGRNKHDPRLAARDRHGRDVQHLWR
jgi:SRSO17 transposase